VLIRVGPEDPPERIDRFVSQKTGITRSQIRQLVEGAFIKVNGRPVKPNYKIRKDDAIEVSLPEKKTDALIPEDIPVEILYRDEHLAVVNKPPGLVVYPAAGHRGGTLMNTLLYHLKELAAIGGPLRPGVVHRLDKDTSGVMVVALSNDAYYGLVEQFRERTIKRSYVALIYGSPRADRGEITLGIGRSPSDRKKMSTRSRRAKEARTSWQAVRRLPSATLIKASLATGRTHQIRVHLASVGHPVLGDRTYGRKTSVRIKNSVIKFPRQMLHAEMLGFTHPVTGKYMEFESPMPGDMQEALRELEGFAS
jgi:23S rRNA pseudouridine1911/1915/1917 synthase